MKTVELSESGQALIDATRDAYEPPASKRARVKWRVEQALSSSAPPAAPVRWGRRAVALAAAAGVLGVASLAAALVWQSQTRQPPERAVTPPASVASEATATVGHGAVAVDPEATSPSPPERAAPRPAPASPRTATPGGSQADLSAETDLIARAQAATNRGEGDEALELLERYDRRFKTGALTEERAAARVFALCAAGQGQAARAEAARFLQRWPRSPQAGRVRSACQAKAKPR